MKTHLLALAVSLILVQCGPAQDPDIIPIGLVDSMIGDLSPGKRKMLDSEFPRLVQDFTGLKSIVFQGGEVAIAAKKLAEGQWRLGVFQGIEFAWAAASDSKLKPLILIRNGNSPVHAFLVVKSDSKAAGFADLKGKTAHLIQAREHARLFADKETGGKPEKFFAKLSPTVGAQGILDDVLLGKVDAAIVDSQALDYYQELNPSRFKRLKVLAKSDQFPATVIAFYEGKLSDNALDKFRNGMVKANQSDTGKEAMGEVNITAFENVTPEFRQVLESILKSYPAPKK